MKEVIYMNINYKTTRMLNDYYANLSYNTLSKLKNLEEPRKSDFQPKTFTLTKPIGSYVYAKNNKIK